MTETLAPVQIADLLTEPAYTNIDTSENATRVSYANLTGGCSILAVPMIKGGAIVGAIFIYRTEVRTFTEKQIALVTNFAAPAVIAVENTRLLNELRQREQDLTVKSTALAALSSKLAKYLAPQVYNSIFTGQQDVEIVSTLPKHLIWS